MAKKDEPWFWRGYMWGLQPIHWKGVVWIGLCVAVGFGANPFLTWLESRGVANADDYSGLVVVGSVVICFIVSILKTDTTTKRHK